MIDSLNKEDKNGMDLLTRSEWISPVGMTVFISCNLALSDLRVLKWRKMFYAVEEYGEQSTVLSQWISKKSPLTVSPLLASYNASIRSEYYDAFVLNVHIYIIKVH